MPMNSGVLGKAVRAGGGRQAGREIHVLIIRTTTAAHRTQCKPSKGVCSPYRSQVCLSARHRHRHGWWVGTIPPKSRNAAAVFTWSLSPCLSQSLQWGVRRRAHATLPVSHLMSERHHCRCRTGGGRWWHKAAGKGGECPLPGNGGAGSKKGEWEGASLSCSCLHGRTIQYRHTHHVQEEREVGAVCR